jgi:hypothetical protein
MLHSSIDTFSITGDTDLAGEVSRRSVQKDASLHRVVDGSLDGHEDVNESWNCGSHCADVII